LELQASDVYFLGGVSGELVSLLLYSAIQFRRQRGTAGCKRLKGTAKESFFGLLDFSFAFIYWHPSNHSAVR